MNNDSNCAGPAPGGGRTHYGHRSDAPDSHIKDASGTTAHRFYSMRAGPTTRLKRMFPLSGAGLLKHPAHHGFGPEPAGVWARS